MGSLVYIRLIGCTFGTLLMLFWMVVILGYRRQRNFERVLFFLCLAFFLFYCGSLLALNAQIYYQAPPYRLLQISAGILLAGLCAIPPVLIHLNFEYAEARNLFRSRRFKYLALAIAYAPTLYFAWRISWVLYHSREFNLESPGRALGLSYGLWLAW